MHEQLRIFAFVVMLIGVLLATVSLFADPLALGSANSGFGWKQISGTIVGLLIAGGGLLILRRIDGNEEGTSR